MLKPLRLALVGLLLLAGCATPAASPSVPIPTATAVPSPTESPTESPSSSPELAPTDAPTASPSAGEAAPVVVTFRVGGSEEYRILLTHADDIATARALLSGEEKLATIPNGLVVRGDDGGVNVGYNWHIDPDDVEFAEFSVEVCDGTPSMVEAGTISGERFCPWSAVVIAIEPADG